MPDFKYFMLAYVSPIIVTNMQTPIAEAYPCSVKPEIFR